MIPNQLFLGQLIQNEHRAMRVYILFAVSLVFLGVIVIMVASLSSASLIPDALKGLFQIGGAFISSLCTFQVKEILARKEKVEVFQMLTTYINGLEQKREPDDVGDRKRIDELLWQIIEKTTLK